MITLRGTTGIVLRRRVCPALGRYMTAWPDFYGDRGPGQQRRGHPVMAIVPHNPLAARGRRPARAAQDRTTWPIQRDTREGRPLDNRIKIAVHVLSHHYLLGRKDACAGRPGVKNIRCFVWDIERMVSVRAAFHQIDKPTAFRRPQRGRFRFRRPPTPSWRRTFRPSSTPWRRTARPSSTRRRSA